MNCCDKTLGKFDPLNKILMYDDFDAGINGWTEMMGNYEDSLDTLLEGNKDFRTPQLSNLTMWDSGSAGSYDGTYALKLATRPETGKQAVAIKRLTYRRKCRIRVEAIFTYKPEATKMKLLDNEFGAFGFLFDLQNEKERIMPHVRYLNYEGDDIRQTWQFKSDASEFSAVGGSGKIVSHYHLGNDGWRNVRNGCQRLCYNELPTKQNWHYFRMDFDLASMSYVDMQCNEKIMKMEEAEPLRIPAMNNLWNMLNLIFFVRTNSDNRAFLYIDSVLLSSEE